MPLPSPKQKRIAVSPAAEFQARPRLFRLLSELYPVTFEVWQPDAATAYDAVILWEGCADEPAIAARNLDCFVVARAAGPLFAVEKRTVNFGATAALNPCFRGQTMVDEVIGDFPRLRLRDRDEVVCTVDAQPYWLVRPAGRAAATIVALPPEEFSETQTVYDHFNRRRWLRLLPFFHFLKQLTRADAWQPPPPRACLMFDDPNLHWPTYGFIDLRKMAAHARELNYHVSFAMVPLDAAGFVHPGAGALFRENRARLSLCVHGNDHARNELGSPLTADAFTQLFAQGLRRIDRFERRSGVPVSRVMVPPYGAFREAAADPMLHLGYEAVCVSRASLTHWNKEKKWPPTFGHSVAEFIGTGLPAIPRQVMAAGHEGAYRLAAFLDQPIIPHAHHQDCAEGLDLVANVASSINGLGQIVWMDMAAISRSNYLTRRVNGTLAVKMLARRIVLPVDADVKEIVVERPWILNDGADEPLFCTEGSRTHFAGKAGRQSAALPLRCDGTVELFSPSPAAVDCRQVGKPRFEMKITARRFLSEARDRLVPFAAGIRRKPAAAERKMSGAARLRLQPHPK